MKFPKFVDLSLCVRGLIVLAGLFLVSPAVLAQKIMPPNPSADLDSCRNGPTGTDPCVGNNWGNGNLGTNNSHYAEDEFVPYRVRFSNLNPGTSYTLVIGYDTIHSGKHAFDYLGGAGDLKIIDRLLELAASRNVDGCDGGVLCSGLGNTFTIGQDPLVLASINPFTLGPVYEPQNRVVRFFGATPTSFAYTANNVGTNTEREVTLTFTANLANAVLVFGAHVAFGGDWGVGSSAGGINGSPYHVALNGFGETGGPLSGGGQDSSISADAVTPAAIVTIIKVVNALDGSGTSTISFPFTANAIFGLTNFGIVDNVPGSTGVAAQSTSITNFGVGNQVVVNEENTLNWSLADITCNVNIAATATTNIPVQPAAHAGTATITLNPGGIATCTFTNTQVAPTAAPASVSGRVLSSNGSPLMGVTVVLIDASTGQTRSARSNTFGYFVFNDCMTEDFYLLRVASSKRYSFASDTRSFTLLDNLVGMDFVADP